MMGARSLDAAVARIVAEGERLRDLNRTPTQRDVDGRTAKLERVHEARRRKLRGRASSL